MTDGDDPSHSEFARGWPIVLTAACGVGLGVSGLLTYNSGLFAPSLSAEIGLSRATFGAAFFGSTLAMAVAMPMVGRLVDRFGPRIMATCGAALLSASFLALSLIHSVAAYVIVMVLIGLLTGAWPRRLARVLRG